MLAQPRPVLRLRSRGPQRPSAAVFRAFALRLIEPFRTAVPCRPLGLSAFGGLRLLVFVSHRSQPDRLAKRDLLVATTLKPTRVGLPSFDRRARGSTGDGGFFLGDDAALWLELGFWWRLNHVDAAHQRTLFRRRTSSHRPAALVAARQNDQASLSHFRIVCRSQHLRRKRNDLHVVLARNSRRHGPKRGCRPGSSAEDQQPRRCCRSE